MMRLSQAMKENKNILGIIKGSAINQNGVTSGLTVPSPAAQKTLIEDALKSARIKPDDVSYVEAHGTGTALGDPIELKALQAAYCSDNRQTPLLVGSVKSNIGHAESAAGIAGLIKALLSIREAELPASLHCEKPTPHFDWQASNIAVCQKSVPWPKVEVRRAGVSSFGASGTNAHVILEQAPALISTVQHETDGEHILIISARNAELLNASVREVASELEHLSVEWSDICRTVNLRNQWPHRLAVIARTGAETRASLAAWCEGENPDGIKCSSGLPKLSHFRLQLDDHRAYDAGRLRWLYRNHVDFRTAIESLAFEVGVDIAPFLEGDEEIDALMGLLYAVAVAKTWQSWGLEIDEVAAEGTGYIAAAYIGGSCDLIAAKAMLSGDFSHELSPPFLPILDFAGRSVSGSYGTMPDVAAWMSQKSNKLDADANTLVIVACQDLTDAMADVAVSEAGLDWDRILPAFQEGPAPISKVRFEKRSFWPESTATMDDNRLVPDALFDRNVWVKRTNMRILETDLHLRGRRAFHDHLVYDKTVVAGACHIALMIELGIEHWQDRPFQIEHLNFAQALVLSDERERILQVVLEAMANSVQLTASSHETNKDKNEILHASAVSSASGYERQLSDHSEKLQFALKRCNDEIAADEFYQNLESRTHIQHRHEFRWVRSVFRGNGIAVGSLKAPSTTEKKYRFHPGLIDSCFQLLAAAFGGYENATFVPFSAGRIDLRLTKAEGEMTAVAEINEWDEQVGTRVVGAISLLNANNELIAQLDDVEFRKATPQILLRGLSTEDQPSAFAASWLEEEFSLENATIESPRSTVLITIGKKSEELEDALSPDYSIEIDIHKSEDDCKYAMQSMIEEINKEPAFSNRIGIVFADLGQATSLAEAQRSEVALIELVRCLDETDFDAVELAVLTQGAVISDALKTDAPCLKSAGLWGLVRVARNEHAEMKLRLFDIDESDISLKSFIKLMKVKDTEGEWAIRGEKLYRPCLVPMQASGETEPLDREGSYIVTGAFGSLGAAVSKRLAERGAVHLVLIGRDASTQNAKDLISDLEALGAQITAMSCNVANVTELAATIKTIHETCPPIAGVVHAVGAIGDQLIRDIDAVTMHRVIDAKRNGAWALHEATKDYDLDFFVVFSSASALFGTPGQAAYAAANASLDALANYRRASGLPGVSINWGPWDSIGMASRLSGAQRRLIEGGGLRLIPPTDGLDAFDRLLASPSAQVALLHYDPNTVRKIATARPNSFWRDVIGPLDGTIPISYELANVLGMTSVAEKEAYLLAFCRAAIVSALQLNADEIQSDLPLSALGIDSLMAVEFQTELQSVFGVELPLTQLLDGMTLEQVATYVAKNLPTSSAEPDESGEIDLSNAETLGDMLSDIDSLSEEEMEALIEKIETSG